MSRATAGWCVAVVVGVGCLHVQAARLHEASQPAALRSPTVSLQTQPSPDPPAASSQRALLDTYCVACHNERLRTAGLMLDKMDVEHVGEGAEVWEKMVLKLRARAMPPAGRDRMKQPTGPSPHGWKRSSTAPPPQGPIRVGHRPFIASTGSNTLTLSAICWR